MKEIRKRFSDWLDGSFDAAQELAETDETPYSSREEIRAEVRRINASLENKDSYRSVMELSRKSVYRLYRAVAVVSAVLFVGVLLFVISYLPRYGVENPRSTVVVERYIEKGLEETGAVNIVAGMILDYRAFDTLGESHVLFTALICVLILLQRDQKNMRSGYEDYYTIANESYYDLSKDSIIRTVGTLLIPCIFLYGIYVILNGQNGPGGGFSGGAVMGTGLIIFASAFGFERVDRVFGRRLFSAVTFGALSFYSFAKGYVFFTGANGIENGIPKGTPGAILSGGLILFLDIAVGMVVACTMFGFYSLFRRGNIGGD